MPPTARGVALAAWFFAPKRNATFGPGSGIQVGDRAQQDVARRLEMQDAFVVFMVCMVCLMPFAFVVAVVLIKANARNRELAQVMEERKLMIERGMEPPPLKLPEESRKRRDPLGNLKAGVILLAIALGLLIPLLVWPNMVFMGGHHFAQPVGIVVGVLGAAFIVVHFLVQAHGRKSGPNETTDVTEEESD
jgi:hypothetical protein